LGQWLLTNKINIAKARSEQYQVPEANDSLFLFEESVQPLLELIETEFIGGSWSEIGDLQLKRLNNLLALYNYNLVHYFDTANDKQYLILHERETSNPKSWGTYVFRLGGASSHVVEVPRPLYEARTYEFGLHLFEQLDAAALLIAGSHPRSNFDQSSDVLKVRNRNSLFNLIHYGIFNHFEDAPLQSIQVRAMGAKTVSVGDVADVVLSYQDNYLMPLEKNPLLEDLYKFYEGNDLSVELYNSGDSTVTLNTGLDSQTAQLRYQKNKQVVVNWIAPELRRTLRQYETQRQLNRQIESIGLDSRELNLIEFLKTKNFKAMDMPAEIYRTIDHYVDSENVVHLKNALTESKLEVANLVDVVTKQNFLLLRYKGNDVAIKNINALTTKNVYFSEGEQGVELGAEFVENKRNWYRPRGSL